MYLSANKTKEQRVRKTVLVYFGVMLFCGLFSLIYEHFSHGVYSNYMVYLFLFPLLGGVVPFAALGKMSRLPFPDRVPFNLYNSGIATLSVGSCLTGILEIYGTTSVYTNVYWIVGAALTVLSLLVYVALSKGLEQKSQGES